MSAAPPAKFCFECGAGLVDGANFCVGCGEKVPETLRKQSPSSLATSEPTLRHRKPAASVAASAASSARAGPARTGPSAPAATPADTSVAAARAADRAARTLSDGPAAAAAEEDDDNYNPNISVWQSMVSARHPLYRDWRMLVLRAVLIFLLFVALHSWLVPLLELTGDGRMSKEALRRQVIDQLCPAGVQCQYTLPDDLPFEDILT